MHKTSRHHERMLFQRGMQQRVIQRVMDGEPSTDRLDGGGVNGSNSKQPIILKTDMTVLRTTGQVGTGETTIGPPWA